MEEAKEYAILIDGELVPVDEKVYKAFYQPIWRQFKEAKRRGQCSNQDWRTCKGDCALCSFRTEGKAVSLDQLSEDYDHIQVSNESNAAGDVAASVLEKFTINEIKKLVAQLEPEYQEICDALMSGAVDQEAADSIGISRTAYIYRKKKLLRYLRDRLSDSPPANKKKNNGLHYTHRVKAGVAAMMSLEVLDEQAKTNITEQDKEMLVDISNLSIRGDTPQQRLSSYLDQVKNPYCFRVGKIPVKISFSDDGPTIEDTLTRFFMSIKK